MLNRSSLSDAIRRQAHSLGFDACGFARADSLHNERSHLINWFSQGMQADMHYIERSLDKRTDPSLVLDEAKSIIVLLTKYFNGGEELAHMPLRIARYAMGKDYHAVIGGKLSSLFDFIQSADRDIQGKVFVDSGPVLEKAWAGRAGVGWIGKNSLVLNKDHGSFVALGVVLIDRELEYDEPLHDACGTCRKCIDACPTGAIVSDRVIDARKCIAYNTIERKGPFDSSTPTWKHWIFGCDICQEACPWNHKQALTLHPEFYARKELLNMSLEEWKNLDKAKFERLFEDTAMKRTGFDALSRNIRQVLQASGE
jgi:epoxyqueuosine reductase